MTGEKLILLNKEEYTRADVDDPIRFYFWPLVGPLYRRRVEYCLKQCSGGECVLDVGFGSGITFLNLTRRYRWIYGLDLRASIDKVTALYYRHGVMVSLRNGSVVSMPYEDGYFDTVLLISILEHLRSEELDTAFSQIRRVLRQGGQVVYGVPCNTRFMQVCFFLLGYDIRKHHFSSEITIARAAGRYLRKVNITPMKSILSIGGKIYETGHFIKD
jgi:ubiquinone/menaquinone biosynthesis C-methylase UbiE